MQARIDGCGHLDACHANNGFCSLESKACALRLTLEVIPEANKRGQELCEEQEPYSAILGRVR